MTFTPEQIKSFNVQHDLDTGGYSFENAPAQAFPVPCILWEDVDTDYVPVDRPSDMRGESLVLLFAPGQPSVEWPQSVPYGDDGDKLVLVEDTELFLYPGESECFCHAKLVPFHGAAGQHRPLNEKEAQTWIDNGHALPAVKCAVEYTGNSKDPADPNCTRCDGDGYISRDAGSMVLYRIEWS